MGLFGGLCLVGPRLDRTVMCLGDFARNVETQSKATLPVRFAPMVRSPRQRIENARQRCALDDSSAVFNFDTKMRSITGNHDAHWNVVCPLLEGIEYEISKQLL